jgi:integrase
VYLGTDDQGKEQYNWVGRFPTKKERDAAVARRRVELEDERAQASRRREDPGSVITCDEWADRYVAKYERERKASSLSTVRQSLKAFRDEFGARPIGTITPVEAEDWAGAVPRSAVPQVVALFNYAMKQRIVAHNPFSGLGGGRGRGRADDATPTVQELEQLLDACSALGDYAPQMRALIVFAAYTGMRPGELFELRWSDIDLAANRIVVSRRLYRGTVDTPKSNRAKTIALPPPAKDVLMDLGIADLARAQGSDLVFRSKQGKQLTAPTVCQYWKEVKAWARLDFDLYLATKHYGVHLLYKAGLSQRAIAAQMGWSESAVEGLLRTYGHIDLIALEEIDELYAESPTHFPTQHPSEAAQ